jgi:carbon monoxide dehydrogenase subunit G
MKLEGRFTFNAPRERVWRILNDPDVIARHMPGCESLEPLGDDAYAAVLSIGVGPIKGTYQAHLAILDKQPNEAYTLKVDGSGKPGFVKGEGQVRLSEEGGRTVLHYSGDLEIGGLIARVGQRIIGSISQQMASKFFAGLGEEAERA